MYHLEFAEILLRLTLSVLVSGIIGYDREYKNRPAGIKTHVLVCVGACIVALVQKEIGFDALNIALKHPELTGVLRADDARLVAQVISGIGFLGAGTIMVQHRTVLGLTTAASLWSVAGLGMAVGMGNYLIAVVSALVVMLILMFLTRIVRVNSMKRLEIQYYHRLETKEFILDYFSENKIVVSDVSFKVSQTPEALIYVNVYEIEIPKEMSYSTIIEDLSMNKNVMRIQMVNL